MSLTVYGFVPENSIFLIFFFTWFFNKRRNKAEGSLLAWMIFLICSSTQSMVSMLSALIMKYSKLRKSFVFIICAIIGIGMTIAPYYASELYKIDSSSGFRAVLWGDARDAFFETNFIGVGFGTEYIRNEFGASEYTSYKVTGDDSDKRLLIGTHNSIFDVALRMGLPGLAALIYMSWKILDRRKVINRENDDIYYTIVTFLLLNNSLNMGVAAPNFMLSTALGAGWLLASNTQASDVNSLRGQQAHPAVNGPRRKAGPRRPGP